MNETKLKMINVALEMFHEQGVNGTSIDQILEKSQTGKGQFSYYFKNKEGLLFSCLQYLGDVIKAGETPTGYSIQSWNQLDKWFQTYLDFQKATNFKLSCPIGTIGNEVKEEQKQLRNEIRSFMNWAHGSLSLFFKEKIKKNELSRKADAEALADLMISIMQGGMLLTKITREDKMFKNAAREALRYIHSLRVQSKNHN